MTDMVKNKDYSHPEVGVIRESDLQRMKVRFHHKAGHCSSPYQIIVIAIAQAGRVREIVQTVARKGQKRVDAAFGGGEEEATASR